MGEPAVCVSPPLSSLMNNQSLKPAISLCTALVAAEDLDHARAVLYSVFSVSSLVINNLGQFLG
jgi:hypothetical protein